MGSSAICVVDERGRKPLRRAALLLAPIDAALAHVAATDGLSDEAAHEARKELKRARAALRLLRPALGDAIYHGENATLRDASHAISGLRDAKAQMDTFADVYDRYARRWGRTDLAPVAARMNAELERNRRLAQHRTGEIRKAVALLERSRRRLEQPPDAALAAGQVESGLARMYAKARKGYAAANKSRDPEKLHEWRKRVKYFSNALRLSANGAHGHRSTLAKRSERLADWLGEDHDLAILMARVRRRGDGLEERTLTRLQRVIDERRTKLHHKAFRLGADLFKKKPRRASSRLQRCAS